MGNTNTTLLSIDIGSSRIKIAGGNYNSKSGLYIDKVGQLAVPEYSIEKEHIKNAELLADNITKYIIQKNFKATDVYITIKAIGSVIRDIDLPKANPKELDSMIRNEMIHTYHIDETDVIQYKLIESYKDDSGTAFDKYRAAALNADFVNEYYEFVKMLKLKPASMDINMNSMDKLLNLCTAINNEPIADKSIMIVDYGDQNTTVYIYLNGKQQIFRHLSIGSSEIEGKVGDSTLTPPLEIRKLKEGGFNFLTNEGNEQYYSTLKPYFYNLNEELRNIIRFYANRSDSAFVSQVFLAGGGSKLSGLTEYLQAGLNLPVERIEKMSNINEKIPKRTLLTHLNAFGALIRN